ncbi:MAG: hypothetical protein A2091_11320 [Desulfuromonadales bacterium GWD2_61_12]|nr:MAG: hypothetical protein A2005_09350 [Desulfuromonadales bacterium GWC2_61_20]OGR36774.1 MAG: hypothetical protein A2091_11320 [Desulfuromonadales bacterium GWD2_61_12]HAD04150.1 hypothetical protein [Desulfuromonas sp.]HBT83511.1 hypothetical protein [Desulfuromonas sp.]
MHAGEVSKAAPDLEKGLARETFSRLLAACYYEPESQLVEEDVFGALGRAAQTLGGGLAETVSHLGATFQGESQETLLLDYARLFLGPIGILAKPYGSVWLEGEKIVMGDSTMAIIELYRQGGFELDAEFREVPDHVAAELEFLYLLQFQLNEARRLGDAAGEAKAAKLKQRLLRDHLGRWIGPFAAAMRGGAQTAFYQALADLTAVYVLKELEAC